MHRNTQARDQEPAAEAAGAREHGGAGPDAFNPAAQERRRQPEHHERDRVNPSDLGNRPILARDRPLETDQARERDVEDAESVNLADAKMNRQRRRGNPPAVEARRADCAVAV